MDVLVEKGMIQNPGQILSSPLDGTQELALVLLLLGVPPLTGFYCQLAHCRKKYMYKSYLLEILNKIKVSLVENRTDFVIQLLAK